MRRKTARWILAPALVLLATANLTFWMAHDLFDSESFGNNMARAIQSDRSSEALAGKVVDEVMSDSPVMRELLRSPVQEVVIWLLQHDLFATVITRTVQGTHRVMTRGEELQIVLDAQTIEETTVVVVALLRAILPEDQGQEQLDELLASAASMQDVTLVDTARLPNLSAWTKPIPWIWPCSLLASLFLFAWGLHSSTERRLTLRDVGSSLVLLALIVSLFVPAARQAVTMGIPDPLGQVLADEVVAALMRGLLLQNLVLLLLGIGTIWLSGSGQAASFLDSTPSTGPGNKNESI